nr:MAG TPA: hypothetical protein [Caudoviricetes sp.]
MIENGFSMPGCRKSKSDSGPAESSEYPRFIPQHGIRDETGVCRDVFTRSVRLVGNQCEPAKSRAGQQNDSQCRENASGMADMELHEAGFFPARIARNDAGNREENIDTDKSVQNIRERREGRVCRIPQRFPNRRYPDIR